MVGCLLLNYRKVTMPSARFYFNGKQQLFEVKDYRDFVKWEEMYE